LTQLWNNAPSGPGSTMVAPELAEIADSAFDDIDALLVSLGE
jgi:hypothetical protein